MAAGTGLATFAGGGADVFFGAVGEVAGVSVGHGWVGVGIWFGVVRFRGVDGLGSWWEWKSEAMEGVASYVHVR